MVTNQRGKTEFRDRVRERFGGGAVSIVENGPICLAVAKKQLIGRDFEIPIKKIGCRPMKAT